ncbi:dipeptidase [bacterium]|nr:dipeptidase [bacterium]
MADIRERTKELIKSNLIVDSLSHGPLVWSDDLVAESEAMIAVGDNPWDVVQKLIFRWADRVADDDSYFAQYQSAWKASGVDCVSWTIGPIHAQPYSMEGVVHNLAYMTHILDHRPEFLTKILTGNDIRKARQDGRIGIILNFQDLKPIGENLDLIRQFYLFGVRIMQLTLNDQNPIGTGCTAAEDGGLTDFGHQVVQQLNELGIVVDVSHCGSVTSRDAVKASTKPIMATHTFAQAVSRHDRAKDDDLLRAIADNGGYLGLLALAGFLTTNPKTTISDWLDHLDYLVNLVGIEHVGIGTDFFGHSLPTAVAARMGEFMDALGFRPDHKASFIDKIVGFETYQNFPNLVEGMVSRGYGDEDIARIMGGNFVRVFTEICG